MQLGVANTLIRQSDGSIFAENTDVTGFGWMLEHFFKTRFDLSAEMPLIQKKSWFLVLEGQLKR